MSDDPVSAPIYTINDDVLLYIITFNADMFSDDNALHTTRIASQVCRHWRDLMLESPSLWAKLIDMDRICKVRADKWREELVRRSGAAPLWIKANSSLTATFWARPAKHNVQFFYDFINGNWHRIQKLICARYFGFHLTRSSSMFLPAPLLEHCEASFELQSGVEISNTTPLFANHAPMLRSISFPCQHLNRKAPWLGHLHSMVFDRTYNVPDALAILVAAHSLQELKIDNISNRRRNVATSTFPIASLPHLKSLEYNTHNVSAATSIVEHVEIPANCSLSIRILRFDDSNQAEPHFRSISNRFTRHAEYALKANIFDKIVFNYQRKSRISFVCRATRPAQCALSISIPPFGAGSDLCCRPSTPSMVWGNIRLPSVCGNHTH
ncbi:hypothetical protein HYPSUDRAFT_44320 [Hypholoma sublateritium FD-334 SS-4]|uniref:F-box domain-containing protein n=1 Tax=Hypholoma sublateritium (strain FD-334 SS-4) TaxID=945553 RepID=A0A0D2NKF9_HYPSF|nr:hypothetical protein HYPSUDRAFT_44320 [Hypholoma sublateritium FD-334 SS-4]